MTGKITDEEREKLKKLSADELIDMVGTLREDAERNEKTARDERKKIMEEFLNGGDKDDEEEKSGGDLFDLKGNEAFQKLKKKTF